MTPAPSAPPAETVLVCAGCGSGPAGDDAYPFRCPNRDHGDVDHVLVRRLPMTVPTPVDEAEPNPFVRYRHRLYSHSRALAGGLTDGDYQAMIRRVDAAVAGVDGHGFVATPFEHSAALSEALGFSGPGGVWVKDETGNVAGSHKARHLMGIALHLEVSEMLGLASPDERRVLSVASCGNAALAAAVLAAATGRRLRVFVPVDANPAVVEQLDRLAAEIVVCPRPPGLRGDPSYARLLEDLDAGAVPFTCQGNLNGLAIEGGETLGYEMATQMRSRGIELDHLIVQVGGGALASSCLQSLEEARALGDIPAVPRVHTVQTESAHPLERAYRRAMEDLPAGPEPEQVEAVMATAARHRSDYMWAWEAEPKSIATGILDDETYDWLAVVGGMLRTGGVPVVVDEDTLALAHELGEQCEFSADPTGTSGLAGLMGLMDDGTVQPDERVALIFTGIERS